jgi:hypothetical protein
MSLACVLAVVLVALAVKASQPVVTVVAVWCNFCSGRISTGSL